MNYEGADRVIDYTGSILCGVNFNRGECMATELTGERHDFHSSRGDHFLCEVNYLRKWGYSVDAIAIRYDERPSLIRRAFEWLDENPNGYRKLL